MNEAKPAGYVPKKQLWPKYFDGQRYVRDKVGVVWLLCPEYDGGIATTATASGLISVGINVLRNEMGPLHILQFTEEVLDNCPTLNPDPKLNEPINGHLTVPYEPTE